MGSISAAPPHVSSGRFACLSTPPTQPSAESDNVMHVDPAHANASAEAEAPQRKVRLPPLRVADLSRWEEIYGRIKRECSFPPHTSSTASGTATIKCSTIKDYEAVKQILTDLNISYVTYCPQSERQKEFALRGLFPTISTEAISNELAACGFIPAHIERILSTRPSDEERKHGVKATKDPYPTKVVKVAFSPEVNTSALLSIDSLLGITVKISPFRRPNQPVQCYRCQWLGHEKLLHAHP
jgi:hypothetical protein